MILEVHQASDGTGKLREWGQKIQRVLFARSAIFLLMDIDIKQRVWYSKTSSSLDI